MRDAKRMTHPRSNHREPTRVRDYAEDPRAKVTNNCVVSRGGGAVITTFALLLFPRLLRLIIPLASSLQLNAVLLDDVIAFGRCNSPRVLLPSPPAGLRSPPLL